MAGKELTGRSTATTGKVEASTLIEVIVAMVLIVVVFGIAMMIFVNVNSSTVSEKKIAARILIEKTIQQAEAHNSYDEKAETEGNIQIKQDRAVYNNDASLILFTVTAYDIRHKLLAEMRKVEVIDE